MIRSTRSSSDLWAIARGKLRRRLKRLHHVLDLVEAAIACVRGAPGRTNQPQILDDLEGAIRAFRRDAETAILTVLPPAGSHHTSTVPPP